MKVYTKELKEKVVEEMKKGRTYYDVATELDVPTGTIRSWCLQAAAGVLRDTRPNVWRKAGVRKIIVQSFREGICRKELAEKYGVSYSTVFSWTKNIRINMKSIIEAEKQAYLFTAPTWISVDQKIPDHENYVLVTALWTYIPNPSNPAQSIEKVVRTGYHKWVKHECNCGSCDQKKSQWCIPSYAVNSIKVTHWMELPEKPQ